VKAYKRVGYVQNASSSMGTRSIYDSLLRVRGLDTIGIGAFLFVGKITIILVF